MCWVEQRIISIIGALLVNDHLIAKTTWDRKICAEIRNCVLLQLDGSREGLDRERDVLVVPGGVGRGPGDLFGVC